MSGTRVTTGQLDRWSEAWSELMTKKIEITDEMVERGAATMPVFTKQAVRECLEAALNPPSEPEIEVTEAMLLAGARALAMPFIGDYILRDCYRAMYAARPHVEKSFQDGARGQWWHLRKGEVGYQLHQRRHRRKDDPK